jgi:hypothetical protein
MLKMAQAPHIIRSPRRKAAHHKNKDRSGTEYRWNHHICPCFSLSPEYPCIDQISGKEEHNQTRKKRPSAPTQAAGKTAV